MNPVEDYIASLPDNERVLTAYLRNIILNTSPRFTEKLSYGVPYFFINSRLCFAWPATSPLAGFNNGVVFGLCRGHMLSSLRGLLTMGRRKEVAMVNFINTEQIDEGVIREILFEAIEVDERMNRLRKKD